MQSNAPQPPSLQNLKLTHSQEGTVLEGEASKSAIFAPSAPPEVLPVISDPVMIASVRSLASQLPMSIPEGFLGEPLAPFSEKPFIDKDSDDFWETCGDRMSSSVLGWGTPSTQVASIIRRGKFGIDGLIEWIKYVIVEGVVDEVLVEGKLSCLADAITHL